MDDDMYDEFGNYIGPELGDNSDGDDVMDQEWLNEMNDLQLNEPARADSNIQPTSAHPLDSLVTYQGSIDINDDPLKNAIVLHEDKQYYQDAEEVYKGAETMVQDEDAIPITKPIIEPVKKYDFDSRESKVPETSFKFEYLGDLSSKPDRIRNLAIIGSLHHGKTLLMDMFVQNTHLKHWDPDVEHKYTDTRKDEKERKLSIKSMPMSLIVQSSRDKSYLVNIIDTPGHPNFIDEISAGLRISDGVLLVVDVIEGLALQQSTLSLVKHAIEEELPIILVLNKIDRLVLELKLPPPDAYLKIKKTIEEVNFMIKTYDFKNVIQEKLSPTLGNVVFASAKYS